MCVFRLGDQHCRFTKISTIFVSSFAKKLVLTLFSFTLTQIQNKKKMPNFFLSNWSVCKFCLASKWAVFVFTSVAIPTPLVRYTSLYAILSVALVNLLVRNIYVYIFLFSIVSLSQVKLHICELVLSEKKGTGGFGEHVQNSHLSLPCWCSPFCAEGDGGKLPFSFPRTWNRMPAGKSFSF